MGEKMSFERLRDWHRRVNKEWNTATLREQMQLVVEFPHGLAATFLDAHLTQPAQDFGPVTNEDTTRTNVGTEPSVASESAQPAQAVDVGAVTATDFAAAMHDCGISLRMYARVDQRARQLAKERATAALSGKQP